MKNLLIALLAVGMVASTAVARDHAGHRDGGPFDGSAGAAGEGGDFGKGVLAGILLSTAALFTSHITAEHNQAVYLYADNDAAEFIANEGRQRPTIALAQAMNHERGFLAKAQVVNAAALTDLDVAYLVMKRAEAL
ncbi:hypothetical protein D3C72_842520 [compost metagenome]